MKALHVPTQTVYNPAEVTEDKELRRGPWRCALQACAVPVFFTRGFSRHNPASGAPVVVSAKFSCFGGGEHFAGVPHGAPRPAVRDAAGGDDDSRKHIHRLTGVPVLPREASSRPASDSGQQRTVFEYGDRISGAAGLVEFSRRVEADADMALTERVRHDGTTYWWSELAYGPTGASFTVLADRIRSQVNPGQAYFAQGQAKYRVYPTDTGGLLQLHLVNNLEELLEVHVFMPATDEFAQCVAGLGRGSRVAVVSQNSSVLSKSHGIALTITQPDQLIAL